MWSDTGLLTSRSPLLEHSATTRTAPVINFVFLIKNKLSVVLFGFPKQRRGERGEVKGSVGTRLRYSCHSSQARMDHKLPQLKQEERWSDSRKDFPGVSGAQLKMGARGDISLKNPGRGEFGV